MVSPYLKNKGSAVRFCLWPQMYNIEKICQSIFEYEKSSNKYSWAINHILKYDEKMKNTN